MRRSAVLLVVLGALVARDGVAQTPPPPVPPAVITRDEARHATVRAIQLREPLKMDGRLDDAVYQTPGITDFIQTLPHDGTPTEKTEAWVLFDASTLYISARCWDSAPPSRWIANEMRRDTNQLRQNDHFGVMLDTFHDGRNGYVFYANPLGGRSDQTLSDEGNPNADWNPVWDVRTGRFDGGWTIEMAIPFKTLRYNPGSGQVWGLQFRRAIRRKNEWVHLTPLPPVLGGAQGFFRISQAATLVGLELPPVSSNLELKPYVIGRAVTDHLSTPRRDNATEGDVGLDVKYGITANLTADLTYNTDFAQVEVDEQQVNLTRFGLQFPEKRDFFLEGRGIFGFAAFPTSGVSSASGGSSTSNTPVLFYSRRIGLSGGKVVPIRAGGRVTGKVGKTSIGLLNIETADAGAGAPATNFGVVRLKRDVLRRSAVGLLFANRSMSTVASGANQTYGADGTFSFFNDLTLGGYLARTETPGVSGKTSSYLARAEYQPDKYGMVLEQLQVGAHFNPEVGFLRRTDFTRSYGEARFSPRPRHWAGVRQVVSSANVEYIENGAGRLESRQVNGRFQIDRENSDQLSIEGGPNYEYLSRPFAVAPGVTIPVGGYAFTDATVRYNFGQQRRVSGNVAVQAGQFYNGTIRAFTVSSARVGLLNRWSLEPSLSVNAVTLPTASFTTTVVKARSDFAFSPWMFASALLQYSSSDHVFSSNVRFRWEYRPGSELFVVYTDERNSQQPWAAGLRNRAFVVKATRFFRK